MSDHPSTYEGFPTGTGSINWEDRAALHRKNDGDGLLDGSKSLRNGTFADMIRHMMLLPEEERRDYVIEKSGDREFTAEEATALARHPDFPRAD
ncbi:hypothetical protein [Altererythrobacter sp. MTPC7]|uniref:hypothetical protein n=1 Tax=Altererythrobacter sp. MTPC7 TaxID=3056567 RepID=UPI0036F40089